MKLDFATYADTGFPMSAPQAKVLVISGIRDLAPESVPKLKTALHLALTMLKPEVIRLGGAKGVDTEALKVLGDLETSPRLEVWLPCSIGDAPIQSQLALPRADCVIELGRDPSRATSYLLRNKAMLDGAGGGREANALLAFTDGQRSGGTHRTIQAALKLGLPVYIVIVKRT